MIRKIVLSLVVVGVLITSVYCCSKNNNTYTDNINFSTTILGQKPTKNGLMLNLFDSSKNSINKTLIKYNNANESDLITSIQGNKAYFLIQSTQNNINDRILDVENKKVIDLGWKGHSVAAENDSSILLAKYESSAWRFISFDKTTGTINNMGFSENYTDNSGIRIHHGIFSSKNGNWYIPYSCQQGTFIILLKGETFSNIKISEKELSDLWMLNVSDQDIIFYSGFEGSTNANSILQMQPKLYEYAIKNNNELVLKKNINFDIKTLDKVSNCIGFYKRSNNEYLMLYKTQDEMKLKTILINQDNENINIKATSSPIDIESIKISDSMIAVSGYEKAIYIDSEGNIMLEKEIK